MYLILTDFPIMLVVRIAGTKYCVTNGTGEVLDVELLATRRDVRRPQRLVALCTDKVETSKVIPLAQRVLSALVVLNGEELLGDDLVAVLMVSAMHP